MRLSIYLLISSFIFQALCSEQVLRFPLKKSNVDQYGRPIKAEAETSTKTNFLAKPASIGIKNFFNRRYQAIIQIGSEGKEFEVVLDTGSATLWIGDESQKSKLGNIFECSTSKTCVAEKYSRRSIVYGSGKMSGYKITDNLKLGEIEIPNFSMLLADEIGDGISGIQGILGLSLGRDSIGFPTTLERLKENNLIQSGSFSMYLGDDAYSYGGKTGEIIFGGHDPKYALEDFRYIKLRGPRGYSDIFWGADMLNLGFGSANLSTSRTTPVIFDSGTSFLLLPEDYVKTLINRALAQGVIITKNFVNKRYEFNCNEKFLLPSLIFYFEDGSFDIPASSYYDTTGGTCYLMIESTGAAASLNKPLVIGDVFLKNYYALYTADNRTIGLARAAPLKGNPVWYILIFVAGCLGAAALGMHIFERNKQKNKSIWNSKGITIGSSSGNGRSRLLELNANAGPYGQL